MTDQQTLTREFIARTHMVDSQVRPNQVNDRRIIAAMRGLPRELFAPSLALAYSDADINLGHGRFMLAPMLIARLAQLVLADSPAHVLVIGAGSGYGAAVLSLCGAAVVALEEDARLVSGAVARFAPAVQIVNGPLIRGWPAGGPYDMILIEGAVPAIPAILAAQLVPGGRVVAIIAADGAGIGRAVLAAPGPNGFAAVEKFDCSGHVLPAFRPEPAFSF